VHESSPTASDVDELPIITLDAGDVSGAADQAIRALALREVNGQPVTLQRGPYLGRLVEDVPTTVRGMSRGQRLLRHVAYDAPALVDELSRAAIFQRPYHSKRDDGAGFKIVSPPRELAQVILSRQHWDDIPILTGIIFTPTLAPDGRVLDTPGHDPRTGLWLAFRKEDFPEVPQAPGFDDAERALELLVSMLDEFEFLSELDMVVAILYVINALVRMTLPGSPFYGISANVMGSGKTQLAQVPAILMTGKPAPVVSLPSDPKEVEKTLNSLLMNGVSHIIWDNVEGVLASDCLNGALTAEETRARVLSVSETVAMSTAVTMVATGNNLQIGGDLSARTLICRLAPKSAQPEHRRFGRDLNAWLAEHRGAIVVAALTILRAYIVEKPDVIGDSWRFPEWDRLIRQPLLWLQLPDPLSALRAGEKTDPRRQEHRAVMLEWIEAFIDQEHRPARDLVKRAEDLALTGDKSGLRDALLEVAGDRGQINLRRLGKWLAKYENRQQVVDHEGRALAIRRGREVRGSQLWYIEEVKPC
jgi:putative DNA primase/helicase